MHLVLTMVTVKVTLNYKHDNDSMNKRVGSVTYSPVCSLQTKFGIYIV